MLAPVVPGKGVRTEEELGRHRVTLARSEDRNGLGGKRAPLVKALTVLAEDGVRFPAPTPGS